MSPTPKGNPQRAPNRAHMPTDPTHAPDPRVVVHPSAAVAASAVALEIADLIEEQDRPVLGLATGGTMVEVYAALVAHVRDRDLDVGHVTTFNLDEYMGVEDRPERSFRRFMADHLFEPLGFRADQTHFPSADLAASEPVRAAREFEDRIDAVGGIDLQLLGLGRNGHIAFNEPQSPFGSRTRVIELAPKTRADAAKSFGDLSAVPTQAITMGIGTILEAKALRVLAFGTSKAEIARETLHGPESIAVPSTCMRGRHADLQVHLDELAAALLPGRSQPTDEAGRIE